MQSAEELLSGVIRTQNGTEKYLNDAQHDTRSDKEALRNAYFLCQSADAETRQPNSKPATLQYCASDITDEQRYQLDRELQINSPVELDATFPARKQSDGEMFGGHPLVETNRSLQLKMSKNSELLNKNVTETTDRESATGLVENGSNGNCFKNEGIDSKDPCRGREEDRLDSTKNTIALSGEYPAKGASFRSEDASQFLENSSAANRDTFSKQGSLWTEGRRRTEWLFSRRTSQSARVDPSDVIFTDDVLDSKRPCQQERPTGIHNAQQTSDDSHGSSSLVKTEAQPCDFSVSPLEETLQTDDGDKSLAGQKNAFKREADKNEGWTEHFERVLSTAVEICEHGKPPLPDCQFLDNGKQESLRELLRLLRERRLDAQGAFEELISALDTLLGLIEMSSGFTPLDSHQEEDFSKHVDTLRAALLKLQEVIDTLKKSGSWLQNDTGLGYLPKGSLASQNTHAELPIDNKMPTGLNPTVNVEEEKTEQTLLSDAKRSTKSLKQHHEAEEYGNRMHSSCNLDSVLSDLSQYLSARMPARDRWLSAYHKIKRIRALGGQRWKALDPTIRDRSQNNTKTAVKSNLEIFLYGLDKKRDNISA